MNNSLSNDDLILEFDPFEGDFGMPGDKVFSNKMVIARKPGPCAHCGLKILKKERVRRQASKFDGEMMTHRWCAACCSAMVEYSSCEDGAGDTYEQRSGLDLKPVSGITSKSFNVGNLLKSVKGFDFFSRMIVLNAVGPNLADGEDAVSNITATFECGDCGSLNTYHVDAAQCCHSTVRTKYLCPTCGVDCDNRKQALSCCWVRGANRASPQCPVCLKNAESFSTAAHCCLHTHPKMTEVIRENIAISVTNGASWIEAFYEAGGFNDR